MGIKIKERKVRGKKMAGTGSERQYLLVVREMRGFPKFQLMNVAENYDVINDPNVSGAIAAGSELSEILEEPDGVKTFTLTCTENE